MSVVLLLLARALLFLACVVSTLAFKYYRASRRPKKFPPGPAILPFIGNLHQLPASKAFLQCGPSRSHVVEIKAEFLPGFIDGHKSMAPLSASNSVRRMSSC